MWKVAEDPLTKTYDVYNRRMNQTEEVKAVIKGNKESATEMLVLTSLAKVMQSRNNEPNNNSVGGGPKQKKQRLGEVATILGECPFVALNKLQRDVRVLQSNDDVDACKILTDEYNELEKHFTTILTRARKRTDGCHDFKLPEITSIDYKLEQIAYQLNKLKADVTRGQPADETEANESKEEVEEHAHVERDDRSILSMELDLGEDDNDDAIWGIQLACPLTFNYII
eukprot:scaffold21618_cov63-Attheya_sp.AAC.11